MTDPLFQDGLVLVSDEAWTREEWEKAEKRRRWERAYRHRRYHSDPEYRARRIAAYYQWKERNRDHVTVYNREKMRRKRGSRGAPVGSLHDLACSGPTRDTGCVCNKIRCYDKPR